MFNVSGIRRQAIFNKQYSSFVSVLGKNPENITEMNYVIYKMFCNKFGKKFFKQFNIKYGINQKIILLSLIMNEGNDAKFISTYKYTMNTLITWGEYWYSDKQETMIHGAYNEKWFKILSMPEIEQTKIWNTILGVNNYFTEEYALI